MHPSLLHVVMSLQSSEQQQLQYVFDILQDSVLLSQKLLGIIGGEGYKQGEEKR